MTKIGRAATARRLYHHLLHGGQITAGDMSGTVQTIETLEAEVARLTAERDALLNLVRAADADLNALLAERDALRAALAKARAEGLREAAKIAEDTWHDPEAEAHPNYQAKAILAAADRIEAEANNSTAHQKTAV